MSPDLRDNQRTDAHGPVPDSVLRNRVRQVASAGRFAHEGQVHAYATFAWNPPSVTSACNLTRGAGACEPVSEQVTCAPCQAAGHARG